ncbi:MAG: alpha-amylase family glycosyl hydrolase [Ruminococcus sp.]|nr:alpha-amylase family glycosyl hydrolase [Ruminococcus sp.]
MKKRILSVVLAVCIISTCFIVAQYSAIATTTDKQTSAALVNGITDSNDNATILQCWNWSYENLEKEIPKIASQGFSVVQISPPNEIKEATTGHKVTGETTNGWWMFYQPAGFQINESTDNALGTKAQLKKMVETAHSYGVRVIADSVINHMGTANDEETNASKKNSTDPMVHLTPKAAEFEPVIVNNKLFHSPWFNMTYQYEWNGPEGTCTNDLTRGCTSRLPDLKTEDQRVQDAIYEYLRELVDAGIDGFRFDAAKHIETPSDSANYKSDFWTDTVTKVKNYAKNTYKKDILSYGEILNTCGFGRKYSFYFPFMKVTDSTIYRQVQKAVIQSNPGQAVPQNMANGTKAQTVLWNESHDTYMDGESKNYSKAQRNKTWAAIAARDGITSMYLARPASLTQNLGVASETDWTAKEVMAVNKFNNFFDGQGEYLANSGTVAVIGRGSSTTKGGGAVLVNCANSTATKSAANIPVATMSNGTYKDAVTGTNFVVSGGKITSGTIGNTGVAVLYNEPEPTTAPPATTAPVPTTVAPTTAAPTTVAPTTAAPVSQYEKGDVNRDKLINVKDATLIQKDLVKLVTLDNEQRWLADFDGDNRVSIKDATKIQYKIAGIQ